MIEYIDFKKSDGDIERFINYSFYIVNGYKDNKRPGRKFTKSKCEQDAIKESEKSGLLPPFTIEKATIEPPSEKQLIYLRKFGFEDSPAINKDVAHDILTRVFEEDCSGSPEQWLIELADKLNIMYTAYIAHNALLERTISCANTRIKAVMFCYAIDMKLKSLPFRNYMNSDNKLIYDKFAQYVKSDSSLSKSLEQRTWTDYVTPMMNTKISKSAVEFLENNK